VERERRERREGERERGEMRSVYSSMHRKVNLSSYKFMI